MEQLPQDPVILLSYINTYLRDYHSDLQDLCQSLQVSSSYVIERLALIDYHYDNATNQFI